MHTKIVKFSAITGTVIGEISKYKLLSMYIIYDHIKNNLFRPQRTWLLLTIDT